MSAPGLESDPLLDAAFRSFTRFGFRRTTMADVAADAGMSRPAVYLRVANKAELLVAVGRALLDASLRTAERAAAGPGAPDARVLAVLSAKLEVVLTLAARSEHAVDLLAEHRRADPGAADAYRDRIAVLVADVLAVPGAAEIAALLLRCVEGLEADMHAPDTARERLRLLVTLVTAGLDRTPTPEDT